jgi:hypothetical protein
VNVYLNPYFHWCAGPLGLGLRLPHCVEPLDIKRQYIKDVQIRSVDAADLEIEFTWTGEAVLSGRHVSATHAGKTDVLVFASSFGFEVTT